MRRAVSLLLISLTGCWVAERITGPIDATDRPCPTNQDFFRDVISAQILEPDCMNCHHMGGFAGQTRLILELPDQPDYLAHNYETLKSVAENAVDGMSIILLKPTLSVSHGGGRRFPVEDDRFQEMQELVFRFDHPEECYVGEAPNECTTPGPHPGESPLRPLTSIQYENTVRDLFAGRVDPAGLFPETLITAGFTTFINANIVSESKAEDILLSAESISAQATQDLGGLLECATGQSEAECVAAFVDRFGLHAYRHPLRDEERAILMSIYQLPDFDLPEKVGMIIETALQSPQFLYIDDLDGTPAGEGVEAVDAYAVAQRLSYFFWNTMPDEALFALAADGSLTDPDVLAGQAERMIADPRAKEVVAAFHRDWLRLFALDELQKDASVYPTYSPALARSMVQEIDRVVADVVFTKNGNLTDLLTTRTSFSDTLLDPIYGVDSGSSGPGDFREVTLPNDERSGLLTRAAFLTKHAHDASSAPIARGVFVIRNMLCQDLVIPPGLVAGEIPQIDGSTIRERFAMHRQEAACAACHDKIDPLGFAFERYDGIGQFRDVYANGRDIDTYGAYQDLSIEFEDALDLTDRLVESSVVRDCYAAQWYRYAIGRVETEGDCSLSRVQQRFTGNGGNVQDLMLGIVESDAFRYRRTAQ